jgi:hypothetical protein
MPSATAAANKSVKVCVCRVVSGRIESPSKSVLGVEMRKRLERRVEVVKGVVG